MIINYLYGLYNVVISSVIHNLVKELVFFEVQITKISHRMGPTFSQFRGFLGFEHLLFYKLMLSLLLVQLIIDDN